MVARLTRRSTLVGTAAVLATPWIAKADDAKIRFTAGWSFQGNHSYMLRALQAGYFKEEGVDVTVSRGFGSARTPVDIAAGVFDLGFSEVITALKFISENPSSDVVIVAILDDSNQAAMTVRADGPIKTAKDIEGHTLGSPEADAGRQLFPVYAKFAGIDVKKVTWVTIAPELRESLLVQKRVDGITGNASSTVFNLKRLGIDIPQQKIFSYREGGLNLYQGCYVASRKFAEQNSSAMKKALSGLLRAYVEYVRDPTESIKVLKSVEPLTDVALETERVKFLKDFMPIGKTMREHGISAVEPDRLDLCISTTEEVYNLPKRLTKERVYTDAYLPPEKVRTV
jgi:NitT/TauT family transport system substrate-binding protein